MEIRQGSFFCIRFAFESILDGEERSNTDAPLFRSLANIYLSSCDWILYQNWGLSFKNRNSMHYRHCTSHCIGLYWKRLSKYCSNEIKLLFPRYFSPQQCGAKKLFCSGKKIHLIKSSLEILNLAWHEACRCKWLSAARNEKSRSEMAPGEDIGQKIGKLKLGILSI